MSATSLHKEIFFVTFDRFIFTFDYLTRCGSILLSPSVVQHYVIYTTTEIRSTNEIHLFIVGIYFFRRSSCFPHFQDS